MNAKALIMDEPEFELKMLIKPTVIFLITWLFCLAKVFVFPESLEGSRFKYPLIFLAYTYPLFYLIALQITIKRAKNKKASGGK